MQGVSVYPGHAQKSIWLPGSGHPCCAHMVPVCCAGSGLAGNLAGVLPTALAEQSGSVQLNNLGNFALHCFLTTSDEDEQPSMAPGLRSPQLLCA